MPQVAIIGAGLAGLYTARLLWTAGVDCVVFESRDRVGGRILSVDETGAPAPDGFDLGPSWFWPQMQPAMAELVHELGLPAFPQHSDGDVLFERMSREGPHRLHGYSQEPRSFRIAGGSATLVHAIVAALPPGTVHLGTRVAGVALHRDAVQLTTQRGGHLETVPARCVVAALPPRLLATSVSFTPDVPRVTMQRWRDTPTWMAPHAKFVALYARPFWREAGLSGTAQSMVGPMPEIHDATTASGHAALFGFIGVGADQRAAMGDAALTAACVAQLARLFGPEANAPSATLLKDWAADDFTATPTDRVPGGHPVPSPAPWVEGAWAQHLVLAGSEASTSEPGYLAGAVTAARDGTRAVLQLLNAADDANGSGLPARP